MALSYEEQIRVEMEKIKKLKKKQREEKNRKLIALGELLVDKFPNVTIENFDVVITNFVAVMSSEENRGYEYLGRLLMKRLPQYFSTNDGKEEFAEKIEFIASIVEENE